MERRDGCVEDDDEHVEDDDEHVEDGGWDVGDDDESVEEDSGRNSGNIEAEGKGFWFWFQVNPADCRSCRGDSSHVPGRSPWLSEVV